MESVLENTVPMQTGQAGVQATMTEIGNRNTSLQGNAIPDNNCNINEKNPFQRLKTAGEGPVLTDNDNMVERK